MTDTNLPDWWVHNLRTDRRFVVLRTDTGTTRPEWWVHDLLTDRPQGGPYDRRRTATRMADRWNSNHAVAEAEAPRKET